MWVTDISTSELKGVSPGGTGNEVRAVTQRALGTVPRVVREGLSKRETPPVTLLIREEL